MIFSVIVLLILLLPLETVTAQDSPIQKLSIAYGINHMSRQDLVFSPFVYTGYSPLSLGLSYEREKDLYQKIDLDYVSNSTMLTNPFTFTLHGERKTAGPSFFNTISLDYQIGEKVYENDRFRLITGGSFLTDVQIMNYVYGQFAQFGYFSTLGIGGFGKVEFQPSPKSNLNATIKLPLLFWVARSPFGINDDEFIENTSSHNGLKTFFAFIGDGHLASWNEIQSTDVQLSYVYHLAERWDIGANYQFGFTHTSKPRSLLSFHNGLQINVGFKF